MTRNKTGSARQTRAPAGANVGDAFTPAAGASASATDLFTSEDPARVRAHDAQTQRRRSEERYQALALASTQLVWSTPPDGLVDDMPAWRLFTGQTREQVRGWGWLDAVHPDDRQRVRRQWGETVRAREPYEAEFRLRRRDGAYREFLTRGMPVLDDHGSVREWIGFCTDITERKQAERALEAAYGELAERVADMTRLQELITRVCSAPDLETSLREVLAAVIELTHSDTGLVMLFDEEGAGLRPVASTGLSDRYLAAVDRLPSGTAACGAAIAERRPVVVRDTEVDPIFAGCVECARAEGIRAAYSHPLLTLGGELLGVLAAYFRAPHVPSEREQRLVALYVRQAAAAIDRARQLEAERRQASQLAAAFEAITDAVFIYDAAGRIIRRNAAALRMLGAESPTGPLPTTLDDQGVLLDLRDPQGQPLAKEQWLAQRVLGGEVFSGSTEMEFRLRAFDGRDVLVSGSGAPVYDTEGRIIGGVLAVRDMTERSALQREAATRASQLEATFDAIPDGVAVFDEDGRVARTNEAARALLDVVLPPAAHQQTHRERAANLLVENDLGAPLPADVLPLQRILRGEPLRGSQSADVRVRTHDDHMLLYNISGAPVRDAAGDVTGAVLVIRDNSERKQLEQRTREALSALLQMAEALVSDAMEAGEVTYTEGARSIARRLADLTGRVLGCKRISITAIEAETEQMHPIAVSGLSPAEEQEWWHSQRKEQRLGDPPADPVVIARLRAGETMTFDLSQPEYAGQDNPFDVKSMLAAPMRIGERIVGLLALDHGPVQHTYTDEEVALAGAVAKLCALVIERERLLAERERARADELALRTANQRMNEFMGIVAHELRTPLTTIHANVQLLDRRFRALAVNAEAEATHGHAEPATSERPEAALVRLLSSVRSLLERTERQTVRLDRLVGDLVDASRIRAGKLELRPERLNLGAAVCEAVEEQRVGWPGRDITFEIDGVPAGSLWVRADADRVGQVVTNYLTNALKYSPPEAPVRVTLTMTDGALGVAASRGSAGTWARVAVTDQGPGLPEAERERVWEQFHRVAGIQQLNGSGTGLGLGLYITRTLIERQGGRVGVESVSGQGSTFWFALPIEPLDGEGANAHER